MKLSERLDEIGRLIGRTPIVKLNRITASKAASIFMKLEYMNPGGSHKDRVAYYMLKEALNRGLRRGDHIIEISSGNTAISLAWISARLGLKATLMVEEETPKRKVEMLRLFNARIIRVKGEGEEEDPKFIKARELEEKLNGFFLNQFSNEANFKAHYETTAKEIIEEMNGEVDAFIMGIGTGGTITGVGRRLKEELGDDVKVIGVVPAGSIILHRKPIGEDVIEGLAKDIPMKYRGIYGKYNKYIDEVVEVSEREAIDMVKKVAGMEGFLLGPSTGAALTVALQLAEKMGSGKRIVTIAGDSGLPYMEKILRKI